MNRIALLVGTPMISMTMIVELEPFMLEQPVETAGHAFSDLLQMLRRAGVRG